MDRATFHRNFSGCNDLTGRNVVPCHIHGLIGGTIKRRDVDRQTVELFHAVVRRAVERHHVHIFFQQIDKGQEKASVQPILVEIVRHHI
ncbi:hypothetical protein D3C80_1471030 [compost metagenome]